MNQSFPLLLKLAATAAAGTVALLFIRRQQRFTTLHSLRRNILHALLHLQGGVDGATPPPAILVLGFQGQGKSAFVNTACRALAGEEGPMLLRSETAPVGLLPETATRLAVRVAATAGCDCGSWAEEMKEEVVGGEAMAPAVDFIDTQPLPEPAAVTAADVEAVLNADVAAGAGDGGIRAAQSPECVLLVLRCNRSARERNLALRRLTEIAGVVRNRGLHLLVVLTHKRSLKNCKQDELKFEVACRARTDCVYCIENYTAKCSTKCRAPAAIKNDFDSHYTALTIIRQCIEFVVQHRRQSSRKMISLATNTNEKS